MTKAQLWNEIKATYKFINNVELLNSTGKTYAQITKDELRSFYNKLIDLEIKVDEDLVKLTKELTNKHPMFVAIKNNEVYSVYLVDVSSMTKAFTSNVNNAERLQVVSKEFLNNFTD